jgi:hypothetical protein
MSTMTTKPQPAPNAPEHRFGSRFGSLPYGPMNAKGAQAFAKTGVSNLSGAFIAQAPEGGHYVGFGSEEHLHDLAYSFSTERGSAKSITMIFPTEAS